MTKTIVAKIIKIYRLDRMAYEVLHVIIRACKIKYQKSENVIAVRPFLVIING